MHNIFSNLKVIFFDFGSTLIYTRDPWPSFYVQADRALFGVLQKEGISIDSNDFEGQFETFLGAYYSERGYGMLEKTTSTMLNELLEQRGFYNVPAHVIRKALDAMYALTQQNWYLEDDTLATLTDLRKKGYHLGMISNTSDDENVQQLLDRWRLRPYFENIITSAACGVRKPDERIFRLALEHFDIPPEQAAMVGDAPDADILGANQIGIFSVWITRRVTGLDPSPARPDAVINALSKIPALFPAISSR